MITRLDRDSIHTFLPITPVINPAARDWLTIPAARDWLTIKEAADSLGVSRDLIRSMIRRGELVSRA